MDNENEIDPNKLLMVKPVTISFKDITQGFYSKTSQDLRARRNVQFLMDEIDEALDFSESMGTNITDEDVFDLKSTLSQNGYITDV